MIIAAKTRYITDGGSDVMKSPIHCTTQDGKLTQLHDGNYLYYKPQVVEGSSPY